MRRDCCAAVWQFIVVSVSWGGRREAKLAICRMTTVDARQGAERRTMERWSDVESSGLQVGLAPRRFEALANMEQFVV